MLKNKSIDYIFGMITGASLMLAFWAWTNTDLIASNDTFNDTGNIQQVEITNWSSMPSGGNVTFPSSIDVNLKSFPIGGLDVDVDIESFPYDNIGVDIESVPSDCCD